MPQLGSLYNPAPTTREVTEWSYTRRVSDTGRDALPAHIFHGKHGAEIVILSVSVVRVAERLEVASDIETADGVVKGRPGDFVITQANGERYPILASVFYGTYQILGRVGSRFIGRRLLHPRHAWPIESAYGELDYGPGRGKVAVARGGWIYRSDEDDYGLINADAKKLAHIEVGNTWALANKNWKRRFGWAAGLISIMPPMMTLIALLAFRAHDHHLNLSEAFLEIEGVCLVLGVTGAWWIRKDKWVLKAAVANGTRIASEFQCIVESLGQKASEFFPSMALWRAAQTEDSPGIELSPEALRGVKDQVYAIHEEVQQEVERHRRAEKLALALSWVSVAAVLCCIYYALQGSPNSELLAIWLPSAVGAVHAWTWRRQISNRIGAGREFLSELAFVKSQLMHLTPDNQISRNTARDVIGVLRVLCRAAAEHTQRQMQFAIAEGPQIPV